jgi:hypothetical protein
LSLRRLALLSSCLPVLAGCGSGTARQGKKAAIDKELRQLVVEVASDRRKLGPNTDTLGGVIQIYATPPKGASRNEWLAAIRKDQALQRAIAALQNPK